MITVICLAIAVIAGYAEAEAARKRRNRLIAEATKGDLTPGKADE